MKAESPEIRAERYIERTGTCWIWKGTILQSGYGQIVIRNTKKARAHRFMYERAKGKIPDGLQLDHLCRNKLCVNPDHLEIVTGRENLMRSTSFVAINARKTHCHKGHPLFGTNLNITPMGSRRCKECGKLAMREYRKAKNESR